MPGTNITDFNPYTGETTTTLVDTHTRGSTAKNTAIGVDAHLAAATLTSISPTTGDGAGTVVTLTGTGFRRGASVLEGAQALPTNYVSATSLTAFIGAGTAAGTVQITVRNPQGDVTVAKPFVVT